MGSINGVLKIAAKRSGTDLDQYIRNIESGLKYCWKCESWKMTSFFGIDKSRGDGLTSACFGCRRKTGKPKNQLKDNKRQARNAVNDAVRKGRLSPASSNPCFGCGGKAVDYHHHFGYERSNWLNVQALCRKCHRAEHS